MKFGVVSAVVTDEIDFVCSLFTSIPPSSIFQSVSRLAALG